MIIIIFILISSCMEIIISDSSNCKEYSKDNNCERFWLEEGCIIIENIVGTSCSCVNLVAVVEPCSACYLSPLKSVDRNRLFRVIV
jgi:hypothetical protein